MKIAAEITEGIDSRIVYPCYKSFDAFLDVERLKGLDGFVQARIREHATREKDDFFLNAFRLDPNSPYAPGVREIWLSRTKSGVPNNYLDLDNAELWEPTEAAVEFSPLLDFVATLPFKATGRMLIIYDYSGNPVPAHRDHLSTDLCHHFIWFRTNLTKPFYVLNAQTMEKLYVESYSAWFDTVNQFHGTDASLGLSFSVRVDGVFADDFLETIPIPVANSASRPALWSSTTLSNDQTISERRCLSACPVGIGGMGLASVLHNKG